MVSQMGSAYKAKEGGAGPADVQVPETVMPSGISCVVGLWGSSWGT